jgi:predicted RNase H-like HicB family nuclease
MAKVLKIIKDYIIKVAWDNEDLRPKGLFDLSEYMRHFGPIHFENHRNEDGSWTAVSTNFRHGSIITQGKNLQELEKNIKDAILTSFEIPSSYAKETKIIKVGEEQKEYALA